MNMDWSTPFTIDVITSAKDFVVYCDTLDAAILLHDAIDGIGGDTHVIEYWTSDRPCFRFKSGILVGSESIGYYETHYSGHRILPKYTVYENSVELPELNIPDSIALVM